MSSLVTGPSRRSWRRHVGCRISDTANLRFAVANDRIRPTEATSWIGQWGGKGQLLPQHRRCASIAAISRYLTTPPRRAVAEIHLPPILPHSDALYALLRPLHTALAFLLFATFLVHLSAALMHALIFRDGVFQNMASWRP
jgi:hypothetical protein